MLMNLAFLILISFQRTIETLLDPFRENPKFELKLSRLLSFLVHIDLLLGMINKKLL